jgi:hypothetical protein
MEPDVSIGFGHKVTRSSSLERQLAVMQQAPGSSAFLLLQAWPPSLGYALLCNLNNPNPLDKISEKAIGDSLVSARCGTGARRKR